MRNKIDPVYHLAAANGRADRNQGGVAQLRQLGCNTVSLPSAGSYAVDVPEEVALEWVDRQLAKLMPDSVAIAYPSLRHTE